MKRLISFLVSAALVVGLMPALVLANEVGFASDETEAVETTEAAKEETKSEEKKAKDTEDDKKEEPKTSKSEDETKPEVKEDNESKEEVPEVKEDKEPEAKEEEPETEGGKPAETDKDQQSGKEFMAKEPEVKAKSSDPAENDRLFNNYVNKLLYPEKYPALKASYAGVRLTGNDKKVYDALKPLVRKVAEGSLSNTIITVEINNTGIDYVDFTKEELGIESFIDGSYLSAEAGAAFIKKLNLNLDLIHNALLSDCPSEMYWYDKTQGCYFAPHVGLSQNRDKGYFTGKITVYFAVASAYQGKAGSYSVNTNKIKTVKSSISNAKKVVENAKSKRDYDKLKYYCNYICSQVKYNHDAVNNPTAYGDPWQLIWVFDKNSSTDVVCEGYAKAFKYLCDLSTFNNKNISCLLVSGETRRTTETEAEGHMWNIVDFGNNMRYLVDVTNSDIGSVSDYSLFLIGYASGNVKNGYVHDVIWDTDKGPVAVSLYFKYYEETLNSYSSEQLTLCKNDYPTTLNYNGTCGNFTWSLDHTGILRIDGSGAMENFTADTPAPWKDYAYAIETVSLTGGVTSIGDYAFSGCTSLKYITIPSSVRSIGAYAFYGCTNLSTVSGGTGVMTIGTYAFAKCSKLSSFSIKSSKLKKIGSFAFSGDSKLKTVNIQKTTRLTKSGVKKSLKGSSVKTVKVKKSKVKKYKKYFKKSNSGRKVKVKK